MYRREPFAGAHSNQNRSGGEIIGGWGQCGGDSGAGWVQRQLHIYMYPFYYIDYCMAQTIAFQFWFASLDDRASAWKNYLAFVDKAGTETFEALVKSAHLQLPYEKGAMRKIGERLTAWIENNQI